MKETIIGYTTQTDSNTSQRLTDLDLALQDLDNHFHIRKGEKWNNPNFGSNLPYYVFQPLDDATVALIEQDVIEVIQYDPRFDLVSNTVRVNEDEHSVVLRAEVLYLPTTTVADLVIKFDQEFNLGQAF